MRVLYFGFICLFFNSTCFANDLKKVYADALNNNSDYLVAKSALKLSDEYKISSRGLLLPQLGFQAAYTELDNTYTTGNSLLSTASNIDTQTTDWHVSLEQTLINFSDWYEFKAGSAKTDIGKIEFTKASQELIYQTVQHYITVIKAEEDLSVSQAEEATLKKQLKRLTDHHEVGLVSIADLYEGRAAYDLATVNVLKTQRAVDAAYKRLAAFSGRSYDVLNRFSNELSFELNETETKQNWLKTALQYNHDLLISENEKVAAEYDYKSSKSSHLPTLKASFLYGDADIDGEQYTGNIDGSTQETQQIALTLNIPLYTGGRISSGSRRAAAERDMAVDSYIGLKREVEEQVKGLYEDLRIQVLQIRAMESSVVSTEKALVATKNGFEQGTRSLIDVLTSQGAFYDSRRDLLASKLSFIEIYLSLKKVSGVLSTDDLNYYNSRLVSPEQEE